MGWRWCVNRLPSQADAAIIAMDPGTRRRGVSHHISQGRVQGFGISAGGHETNGFGTLTDELYGTTLASASFCGEELILK